VEPVECALCGTPNRTGARFCGGCGSPLARRCATCKAELDPGLRFCDQCGTAVDAAVPPDRSPLPAAEAVRKTVTVLFVDLGGSTGFGERTDPEVSRQVLARYHALLQDAIDAHLGTVAKFMGDGMMATFGIPEVAEDDAERAVRAGIDIQSRFEQFAADVATRYGETLTARIGINTGEVVIGAADADLVGDALNVAARLEKACRPGRVLVGDETWRLTRGVLAYESLGQVTVAGRAQPVGTYEVADDERAAETVAPFVGRAAELARLEAAFGRAVAARSVELVTVLGSAGLGKTRLSRELSARVTGDGAASAFEIRCDRSGGSTFAPIADLLREAAGLDDAEAESAVDGDVTRERIGALFAGEEDRTHVVDVLAGVVGAAPARSVEETFWAIRRALESLAATRPLIVVIDDIQWAESILLDLLEHLGEWLTGAPVLLVALARPELRELRPALVETGRRVADVLALDGLDSGATEELAAGLLGSALPRELVDRLPASTDGNPLFVRELVRMLVDDRVVLRRDDGTWELGIDADAVEVPPTIQSLLATRVERLPRDELRILELASVVGAEFSVGALHALGVDELPVPALLEQLRRKELVEPTGTYVGDEPVHRFHHVLIRDAAYRRLLKGSRAELHRRVGEWTDDAAGQVVGEHETTIAFHYEQAHRFRTELGTVDDETDRLGRRAAELLEIAARRAFDREDLASAGALAGRALAVLPSADVGRHAELLLVACECLLASGDVAAGAGRVEELADLGASDAKLTAWTECFRAQLVALTDPERLVEAEGVATRAAETLRALGDGAGEAKAHQVRALLLARLGRVGEAETVLDLALSAARAADDRRRVTAVLGAAPQAALYGPSPVARAGGRCLDVVRLLRITIASPSVEATSMRCQAVLEALRGRFDVSRSMLASSRVALEELGLRHGLLETDLFAGMVELLADDADAAVVPLRSAYEGLGTLGVGADAGQAAALLATALLARGEVDEAELVASESEALAGQNLKTAIAWRIAKASVLEARGELDAAVALAEEAFDIASATDLVLDHADACVVLADLRDAVGDRAGARTARADARRLYEAKGATVPIARLDGAEVRRVEHAERRPTHAATPASAQESALGNTAVRTYVRVIHAIATGDDEALRGLVGSEFRHDDRRHVVNYGLADLAGSFAQVGWLREKGFVLSAPREVAVRGERLALTWNDTRTPAGDDVSSFTVVEVDDRGLVTGLVQFDESDVAAAVAELDERFLAGEGAPDAAVLRAARALNDVGTDLAALPRLLADDFEVVDHRLVAFGTGDREYFVEAARSNDAVGLAQVHVLNRAVFVRGRAVLAVRREIRGTAIGVDYQWDGCDVVLFAEDGRAQRLESYEGEDLDAALARLEELGATAGPPARPGRLASPTPGAAVSPAGLRPENTASRAARMLAELLSQGARGSLSERISDRFVRDDRRHVTGHGVVPGKQAMVENLSAFIDLGAAVGLLEVVAVRGDRLALVRNRFEADGFHVELLEIVGLDAAGAFDLHVTFDPEDLGAATAELDEQYLAGEGAVHERVLRICRAFGDANDRRDFDAMQSMLAADFVMDDRTRLGYGAGDRGYFDASTRSLSDVATPGAALYRIVEIDGDALLTVTEGHQVTPEGNDYLWVSCIVFVVGPDDLIHRAEYYDEDRYPEAVSRLHELAGTRDAGDVLPLANATTWFAHEAIDATAPDVRPAVHGLVAPGFRLADRRPVVDRDDEHRDTAVATFEKRVTEREREPGARPDRSVPGPSNAAVRKLREAAALLWTDFEAALELLAPDAVGVARESGPSRGLDAVNSAMWRDVLGSLVATYDTVRFEPLELRGEHLALLRQEFSADGYVTPVLLLLEIDGDERIVGLRTFDLDDFADAVALLDARQVELEARTGGLGDGRADNAAARTMVHWYAVHRADATTADALTTDDIAMADRRRGVSRPVIEGRRAFNDAMVATAAVFREIDLRTLAVRGERLALINVIRDQDGSELSTLVLVEAAPDGRVHRVAIFDHADLVAALDALDRRHVATATGLLPVEAKQLAIYAALNRRDWSAFAAGLTDELTIVDHRRLGFPPGRAAAALTRELQGLVEQVPDVVAYVASIHARGRAALVTTHQQGTALVGGGVTWDFHTVVTSTRDGRVLALEYHDTDRWVDARARFEEAAASEVAAANLARTVTDAFATRDWDAIRALVSDDVHLVDRRSTVSSHDAVGSDAVVELLRGFADVGFVTMENELVAARDGGVTLLRRTFRTEAGFELQMLAVAQLAEGGHGAALVLFDVDDLTTATAELDRRAAAVAGR
jgi:class 3 adenylate cyclase/tetratricopeptide (TPR) repeat protein